MNSEHYDPIIINKLISLINFIDQYNSILISYSGGVDSSLLSYIISNKSSIKRSHCIFINTGFISSNNYNRAIDFLNNNKMTYSIINSNFISSQLISKNNKYRCYYCKSKMIDILYLFAKKNKYDIIFDGTNSSDYDKSIYRPGLRALSKLKNKKIELVSPFAMFNISK